MQSKLQPRRETAFSVKDGKDENIIAINSVNNTIGIEEKFSHRFLISLGNNPPAAGKRAEFVRQMKNILDDFLCVVLGVLGDEVVNLFKTIPCGLCPSYQVEASRFSWSLEIVLPSLISRSPWWILSNT